MFAAALDTSAELRPLEVWHAEELAAPLDRARGHIAPWVGASFVTTTVEQARATSRWYADAAAGDGARLFGIWRSGRLVGGVVFVSFSAATGTCEPGCWLEPGAEGEGLAAAATSLLLRWAFAPRGAGEKARALAPMLCLVSRFVVVDVRSNDEWELLSGHGRPGTHGGPG